jgi:HK97 family phage major capsid protein
MQVKEYLQKQASKRNAELLEIIARLEELAKLNETSENEEELKAASEELDVLKAKKEELEAELAEVNAQIEELEKPADEPQPVEQPQRARKLDFMTSEMRGAKIMNREQLETRANEFAKSKTLKMNSEEVRSVLVSSGQIATPTEVSGINENGFPKVSSILDLVKVVNCEGMHTNRVAYVVSDLAAAEHTEGGVIVESDPTYAFLDITPKTYAVLASISKEAKKQTPLNYTQKVDESARIALRKVAAQVVTAAAANSSLTTALSLTALDQAALRKIAFAYGGNEGIEGEAWLFLNKQDLITLGDVRGSNEKKAVFEITPDSANPNTGIIKDGGLSVKYCINNNLVKGTMLYGNPKNIELDLFSNYDVEVSNDFYFNKLMDAIRGDVQLGADVVAKDGIIKVTVSA